MSVSKVGGYLQVGTNGRGEVVINHDDIDPDKDGKGHIIFTVDQALDLADLLIGKAYEAHEELHQLRRTKA